MRSEPKSEPSLPLQPGDLVLPEDDRHSRMYGPVPHSPSLVLRTASWSVGIGRVVRHLELLDPLTGTTSWSGEQHWRLLCRPSSGPKSDTRA